MAIRLIASSSSATLFAPSSFSHETETTPTRKLFGTWVCQNNSRFHQNKHFELKASNMQPLNAVTLQAGEFLYIYFNMNNCFFMLVLDHVLFSK
jgi:hypothetical protein